MPGKYAHALLSKARRQLERLGVAVFLEKRITGVDAEGVSIGDEGLVSIGAKTVLGQECTISAYQHVSIGRECVIADRVMLIDFDHGMVEVERPIRLQGIYKRDVRVGHNVWIGYGACVLRGVTVGENAVIGTSAVVTKDLPANAVAAGVPADRVFAAGFGDNHPVAPNDTDGNRARNRRVELVKQ